MNTILECSHLTKRYGSLTALDDVSVTVRPGRIVGLLGPNGSGKSTFIKTVAGLLTPQKGSVAVCGFPIGVETKKRVAYLPDKEYLDENLRVEQLVDYFSDFYENFDRNKAQEMLQCLEIDEMRRFKALSKGTREKVQLVLVMSRKADLYLLDEPIGGVDPAARDYILKTIVSNYNEEGSILISTHLISDIEPVLDDVIFIKDGSVVLTGTVDELREEHGKSVDVLFREVFKC
ncbi:ABC transporter ATP-binding protein [Clostridium sp. AN503]|uniref:ABC transporter ATP-binding protein n=1 Tax=Clostridium sp. AN503 TaxID=3160598 RepID=UPI003457F848